MGSKWVPVPNDVKWAKIKTKRYRYARSKYRYIMGDKEISL
jgi:hypothetical protein